MESKEQLFEMIAGVGRDRQKYLENLFKYVPEAIIKEIKYVEIPRNEYLIWAGTQSDTVFILLSGQVMGLDYQEMGRVYSFMDFTKMYVIGDFELFGEFPEYCVSICATKDCKILKLSAESYLSWVRHDENALFLRLNNILKTLTFERKLEREYVFMGCKERLEYFLIKYYEEEKKNDLKKVKLEKTQAELADKVGFNKRSIQRSIAALEKEKLINIENGKITISHEQYLKLKQDKGGKEEK